MPNYDDYGAFRGEGDSPNLNRAYQRMVEAGQAPDNSWLERLFQRKQAPITQQPLPPMVPTDEGRFPPQAAPSPFGGGNAGQRTRSKPASKLSSAAEIAQRAGQFMSPWTTQSGAADSGQFMSPWTTQGGSPPAAQSNGQFMSPWTTQGSDPTTDEPPMRDPGETGGWPEPTPRQRIDMRTVQAGTPAVSTSELAAALARFFSGQSGQTFGGGRFGGNEFGGNQYGGGRYGASAGPGETGGWPSLSSAPSGGIFPPTSDEGRGVLVSEAEDRQRMQNLTRFAQTMARLGVGETGGTPETNLQQNQTFWDLLRKGGNKFGGNTYGGRAFGGWKNPNPFVSRAEGGFIDNLPVPDEIDVPHPPAAATPVPPLVNPPQAAPPAGGGGGGGGGDSGIGGIANLAMTLLPMFLKDGGAVPGFMRGGYPELYNAPIRHQFDSGGQSYVDASSGSSGRADDIDARLSPKEYVLDSETMAMLGDGNPDAGAKKMDQFRSNIRKHKGKALAKGRFSPNAKNPAEYLIGNPMSDGLARLSRSKK